MEEIRYIISDASKKIDVEQYTLRYWEDELNLDIKRNEMGHRYYRDDDLEIFKCIKVLKEKGYQLRAIKMLLPDIVKSCKSGEKSIDQLHEEWNKNQVILEENDVVPTDSSDKVEQFRSLLESLIVQALDNNNEKLAITVTDNVTNSVIKEMDYMFRVKEEREEERFKRFDKILRDVQSGKSEVAATKDMGKKKRLFF